MIVKRMLNLNLLKMKKLKYIIIIVSVFAMSCGSDFLDVSPSGALPSDTSIQTVTDMEAILLGAYSQFQNSDHYGLNKIQVPTVPRNGQNFQVHP